MQKIRNFISSPMAIIVFATLIIAFAYVLAIYLNINS